MRNAGSHVYLLLKFECLWRDIDRYIPISLLVLIFSLDRGVPRRMTIRRSKGNDDFVSRVLVFLTLERRIGKAIQAKGGLHA